MPEQDNLEFRKKTYKNLKTAFGDDYTLTEDQFNKNMDSDTAFVTKTYKDLKTAYGDDYAVGEEDFKKKVLPVSGKPITSASGSGSAPTQPLNGSGDSRGRNPKISFLADIVTELNPDAPKLKEGQSVDDWGKELTTFAKQYPMPKEGEPWKKEDSITRMRYKLAQKNANFEEFVDERLPQVEGMTERDKNLFLYKEYLKENNPTALKKYEESRAYKTDAPGVAAKLLLDTTPEDTERIDAEFYDKALEMSQNYLNIKYKKLNELTATPQFKELMNVNQSAAQEMDALNKSYESGNIDRANYESTASAIKQRYDQSWAELAPVMETANKLQAEAQKNLIEASTWINRFPAEAKRRMEEKAQDATNEVLYELLPDAKLRANLSNQVGRGVTEFIANTFSLPQVFSQDSEYGWSDRMADVSQEWASAVNKDLFPVPKKMEKGIVNTDYSVNWDLVLPKTVRTLTDMGIMASTGSASGTVATSFVMNAKSYYDEALAQKMNTQDASKFAVSMAMQQSLLELVNPEYALIKRGLTKMATKDATRMLSEGVSLPDAIKATAKAMGKNMVMENAQEQMQLFGDMTGKMAANIITGSDFEFDDIGQQVTESLLLTSIVSALGGGGIGASQNSRSELEKRAIYSAVDSPELLLEATQKAVAAGTLDPIAAQRINLTVGELKQNLDALPSNVKETERSEVVNALFDKNKLVQIASNEALDPSIKKVYEDKIKEIDASVGKIIAKYVTPEKVEEVIKPTVTEGVVETADVIVPKETEVEIQSPNDEQKLKDIQEGNVVTFVYNKESDIPLELKEKVSSFGDVNGKKEYKVTLPKSEADYLFNKTVAPVTEQITTTETPVAEPAQSEQSDIERRTQEEFNNENESYRVIVGDEAFNDIVESGVVRTNADSKKSQTLAERLANRPTLFPSFSKGKASMEYAAANPNNYIIVTEDPSIQPSTAGRHGKGTTMFPTDENGNHLKELSGKKVKVYKHIGNGEYILVYANGKVIEQQIEKPAQSEAIKEDATTNTTTDGKETDQGQKGLLSNVTEDAAPIPEAPPLTTAEPVVKEAAPTPTEGSEKKERSFTKQAMKSPDISGESKAKIKEEAIYYMTQRNVMSVAEANKIIDDVGLEEAIKILKDFNNGINGGVRGALGQIIIKQLESRGEVDEAIDVLNWLTQEATDSGQFIQAFSLWAALTAQGQIRAAQKMIKDQRESRAKKQKAKITAVKEGMKAAAKEAIDEALVSTGVKAGVKLSNKRSSPTYGAKNKITTREEYLEAKAKLRGKLFSNPLDSNLIPIAAYHLEASGRKIADFTANLIDEFGGGVRPYIKPMYEKAKAALIERGAKESDFDNEKDIEQQIQEAQNLYWEEEGKKVIAKLDRAIKTKNDKAYKEAIAELQSLPNRDELWGKYKEYAAKRLANLSMKQFAKDANEKPVLQNFTDELARTMQDKIKEALPESERTTTEPRPVIEVIADAFKNKEKYQEVWDEVQSNLRDQLTNEQLAELDAYFGNILDAPFSQKQISKAVKDGLASIDKKVADIARAHYTQYDVAKRTLTQKLISEAQLPEDQAAQLADAISKEFDRIMTEKKKKLLDDMFKKRVISKKQKVNLETELQTLLNLGAFNDDMLVEQWAKANGYPVLTSENIAEIERLLKIIQEQPDGSKKFRAIQDLLKYQGSIKGVNWKEVGMAIWYANVLSGYNTQLVNAFSTSLNVASNYFVSFLRDWRGGKFLAQGFYRGFTHGILEGAEVLRTGYDPVLKGKLELPATLEIKRFAGGKFNPANYLKYVRRVMMATDVLFFEGAKEMRAYQLARSMAKDEAKLDPSLDVQKRAEAILNKTDYDQQIINEEVELEYQAEVDRINAMPVSNDIKNKLLTQAKRDKSRRAFEKAHLGRKESIIEGAASFASRSTYNYKPEGALGYIVNGINTVLHKMPLLRLVIPFTNIIANVANEQINYTPVGFWRAYKDGSITGGRKNEITPLEKSELYAKAALGTTLMAATLVAAILPVGDDDEPLIEITANGTGDYVKNYNLKDWMPYSIRVKGGKWVSYQYSPMMVGLSVIGNLMDGEKYRGEKLKDESTLTKFSLAMSASMRVFLDMTFLASLNSALDIIMNPFNPNVADTFAKSAQSTAKGFAIPNLYNQSFKQVQASFDIPNKMVRDTYLGWLLKDIPVARDMYKDQLDILGNPVVPNTDKFVKDGSDITPIYRLIQNQMPNMRVPSIKVAKVTDPKTDEETKMTEAEYYVFCQIRGNYIKQEILKADKERKLSTLDKDWATQTQSDATEIAEDKIYQLRQSYLK